MTQHSVWNNDSSLDVRLQIVTTQYIIDKITPFMLKIKSEILLTRKHILFCDLQGDSQYCLLDSRC